jgi:5-methylthioadenosine/S-adenosylhomocysteine deaminase
VIEAAGLHAFPALRNGHTHAAMTLFRGWGDDMPLMEWLRTRIWPAEALLTEDDVYHGTRLACLEMIRGGTTYLNDMYWHHAGVAGPWRRWGSAPTSAPCSSTSATASGPPPAGRGPAAARPRHELGPPLRVALTPHAIYTVTPRASSGSASWPGARAAWSTSTCPRPARRWTDCVAAHGVSPGRLLERVGLVGPNLIAAHGVYLEQDEIERSPPPGPPSSPTPPPT